MIPYFRLFFKSFGKKLNNKIPISAQSMDMGILSTPAEPCNRRPGTLPSKVGAYHWPHCSQRPAHLSRQVNRGMPGEVCKTAAESISAPFKVTSVPLIRLSTN